MSNQSHISRNGGPRRVLAPPPELPSGHASYSRAPTTRPGFTFSQHRGLTTRHTAAPSPTVSRGETCDDRATRVRTDTAASPFRLGSAAPPSQTSTRSSPRAFLLSLDVWTSPQRHERIGSGNAAAPGPSSPLGFCSARDRTCFDRDRIAHRPATPLRSGSLHPPFGGTARSDRLAGHGRRTGNVRSRVVDESDRIENVPRGDAATARRSTRRFGESRQVRRRWSARARRSTRR